MLTSTRAIQFEKGGLLAEDPHGKKRLEGFDSIVVSLGASSNDEIVRSIRHKASQVYVIGDASKPRELMEALYEGEEVALKI
jgi:2,4-dienoyl-CoA reductase (NADPH2)